MRFAFVIAVLLFTVATPAKAVPLVGEAAQTCFLNVMTSNPQSLAAMQKYNMCPVEELRQGLESYISIRVEPGMAADPVDLFGYARYIDNRTPNAIFVGARTQEEWTTFVKRSPSSVDVVPACRPVTLSSVDTCGDEVKTGYARVGTQFDINVGTGDRVLTFTCAGADQSGIWTMSGTNGKGCTQTASADAFDRTGEVQAVQQGWAVVRNFSGD